MITEQAFKPELHPVPAMRFDEEALRDLLYYLVSTQPQDTKPAGSQVNSARVSHTQAGLTLLDISYQPDHVLRIHEHLSYEESLYLNVRVDVDIDTTRFNRFQLANLEIMSKAANGIAAARRNPTRMAAHDDPFPSDARTPTAVWLPIYSVPRFRWQATHIDETTFGDLSSVPYLGPSVARELLAPGLLHLFLSDLENQLDSQASRIVSEILPGAIGQYLHDPEGCPISHLFSGSRAIAKPKHQAEDLALRVADQVSTESIHSWWRSATRVQVMVPTPLQNTARSYRFSLPTFVGTNRTTSERIANRFTDRLVSSIAVTQAFRYRSEAVRIADSAHFTVEGQSGLLFFPATLRVRSVGLASRLHARILAALPVLQAGEIPEVRAAARDTRWLTDRIDHHKNQLAVFANAFRTRIEEQSQRLKAWEFSAGQRSEPDQYRKLNRRRYRSYLADAIEPSIILGEQTTSHHHRQTDDGFDDYITSDRDPRDEIAYLKWNRLEHDNVTPLGGSNSYIAEIVARVSERRFQSFGLETLAATFAAVLLLFWSYISVQLVDDSNAFRGNSDAWVTLLILAPGLLLARVVAPTDGTVRSSLRSFARWCARVSFGSLSFGAIWFAVGIQVVLFSGRDRIFSPLALTIPLALNFLVLLLLYIVHWVRVSRSPIGVLSPFLPEWVECMEHRSRFDRFMELLAPMSFIDFGHESSARVNSELPPLMPDAVAWSGTQRFIREHLLRESGATASYVVVSWVLPSGSEGEPRTIVEALRFLQAARPGTTEALGSPVSGLTRLAPVSLGWRSFQGYVVLFGRFHALDAQPSPLDLTKVSSELQAAMPDSVVVAADPELPAELHGGIRRQPVYEGRGFLGLRFGVVHENFSKSDVASEGLARAVDALVRGMASGLKDLGKGGAAAERPPLLSFALAPSHRPSDQRATPLFCRFTVAISSADPGMRTKVLALASDLAHPLWSLEVVEASGQSYFMDESHSPFSPELNPSWDSGLSGDLLTTTVVRARPGILSDMCDCVDSGAYVTGLSIIVLEDVANIAIRVRARRELANGCALPSAVVENRLRFMERSLPSLIDACADDARTSPVPVLPTIERPAEPEMFVPEFGAETSAFAPKSPVGTTPEAYIWVAWSTSEATGVTGWILAGAITGLESASSAWPERCFSPGRVGLIGGTRCSFGVVRMSSDVGHSIGRIRLAVPHSEVHPPDWDLVHKKIADAVDERLLIEGVEHRTISISAREPSDGEMIRTLSSRV